MRSPRNIAAAAALGILTIAAVYAGGGTTAAPADKYGVDAVHSAVIFRIKHLGASWSYGRFNEIEGSFAFSADAPEACAIDIKVKTASIDTANADRDTHLRSPEYFDAEKYKEIAFKSREFKKAGDNQYTVKGDLTFHGMTKPIDVKFEWVGVGKGFRNEVRGGFEAVFEIKRSEYGMKGGLGALGDEVRLIVAVEGVKKD